MGASPQRQNEALSIGDFLSTLIAPLSSSSPAYRVISNQREVSSTLLFEDRTTSDSMEVVGAVASCIALAQGLEAGVRMVGFLKSIPDIQQDFEALQKEIRSTRGILLDSQKYAEVCPDIDDSPRLNETIQELKNIESELSDFATSCSRVKPARKEKAKKRKWILEANNLQKLRQQLAVAKTNLQFAVTSHHAMTMNIRTASMAIEMACIIRHLLHLAPPPPAPQPERVEELLEVKVDETYVTEEIEDGSDDTSEIGSDNDGSDSQQQITSLETDSIGRHRSQIFDDAKIDQLRERLYGARAECPPGCQCRCHFGTTEYKTQPRLRAILGSLSLSYNTVPGPARTECTEPRCKRGGSVTFVLEHYFPTWFWAGVLSFKASYDLLAGLRYSSSLRPCRILELTDAVWFAGNDGDVLGETFARSWYHPEDITVLGYGIIEDALYQHNFEASKILLRLWKNLLAERGLPRRVGFLAIIMLDGQYNDGQTHVLWQVLELSGLEMTATKLHSAVTNGESLQSLQTALKQEPWSIDVIGNRGRAPIHDIVVRNQFEALGELISAGANIDLRDSRGWTPLSYAAAYNRLECMQRLLQARCNVHLQNEIGATALHWAVVDGSPEGVAMLLVASASVSARDQTGKSPVHALAHSIEGTGDKLAHLQTAPDFNIETKNSEGWTAIIQAVAMNNATTLRCLVDAGASLVAVTNNSHNILHFAAIHSSVDVLHYLTSRALSGINTELGESRDYSPWDALQLFIHAPRWLVGGGRRPGREEQEAFAQLYQDIRGRNLQNDLEDIAGVLQYLSERHRDAARAKLASIIRQKQEWERFNSVQAFRDIDHQVQQGEWESATYALNDVMQEIRDEMESSPWEKTSYWGSTFAQDDGMLSDDDMSDDGTACDISIESNEESTGSHYEDATSQPSSSRRGSLGEDRLEELGNTRNTS
ncbi:hypothetical protein B0J13DRAFT_558588 [Dactylonectria estremocensis]|uniref:Fungal N-terminal domain-containing protein n=1 Tax=Dactylonectria estremocensis TaxID=1079267 RepID=A0A9P9IZQ3_9HYPO|nr:hypothetical protein B0J13DRAFT_558588 [Dactylonectria estremocensis]